MDFALKQSRKARDRCKIECWDFMAQGMRQVHGLAGMIGHRDIKSPKIYDNATASEIANRLD
jgi:hypothetical protein